MPAVEGWTFVLFACGRLVTKQHALQSRDVANVTRLAVRVAAAVIRANASPRSSSCARGFSAGSPRASRAASLLLVTFEPARKPATPHRSSRKRSMAFCARRARTRRPSRAAPAWQRCASRRPTPPPSRPGVWKPRAPPCWTRTGPETSRPRRRTRCAGARSPSPPSSPEAWPPSQRRASPRARQTRRRRVWRCPRRRRRRAPPRRSAARASQAASSAPPFSAALDLAATESVHAGLALYVALVETRVTVEASLAASRRALAALAPGDEDSLAGKRALRDAVFPAVASAVEAARLARPVFAACGFGTDASESGSGTRVRRKSVASLRAARPTYSRRRRRWFARLRNRARTSKPSPTPRASPRARTRRTPSATTTSWPCASTRASRAPTPHPTTRRSPRCHIDVTSSRSMPCAGSRPS